MKNCSKLRRKRTKINTFVIDFAFLSSLAVGSDSCVFVLFRLVIVCSNFPFNGIGDSFPCFRWGHSVMGYFHSLLQSVEYFMVRDGMSRIFNSVLIN